MTMHAKVLKYTLLPGITPRLMGFFGGGFSHIAYLIAIIYHSLRLLPASHPYLNPQNVGRYGIRHVVAEAANNLVICRKNTDQVIIFATILVGLVLLLVQILLLLTTLIANPAFAFALTPLNILQVGSEFSPGGAGIDANHPAQDMAFILLDRIFGIVGIFNSCVSDLAIQCLGGPNNLPVSTPTVYPFPMHVALHTLLQFYSRGIFVVAVFIIIYFTITIIAETAETGTPFGQRYNHTWVPIRLIVFFALLAPLNVNTTGLDKGLNAAQLIVFWSAKTGSNFATNAWGRFYQTLDAAAVASGSSNATLLGDENNLIATPKVPKLDTLTRFMFVVKTCQIAEETQNFYNHTQESPSVSPRLTGINGYLVRSEQGTSQVANANNMLDFRATNYADALTFSNDGTIIIRFGSFDNQNADYQKQMGNVFPFCGEIKITVPIHDDKATTGSAHSGAFTVQEQYYQLLQQMWDSTNAATYAECMVRHASQKVQDPTCAPILDPAFRMAQIDTFQAVLNGALGGFISQQIANGDWNIPLSLKDKGWAGVALWYNRIAEMNQNLAASIYNLPQPSKYPYVMEVVSEARKSTNNNVKNESLFDPILSNGQQVKFDRKGDDIIAGPMYNSYLGWVNSQEEETKGKGIIIDIINAVFGTTGLFDMRSAENINVHPLAQLSSLGTSMMNASITNLGYGFAGSIASEAVDEAAPKALLLTAGNLGKTIGTATLAMSFILAYVLPALPFIYFIFAVSGWLKSIFEAIVAMPLWALAHISRIDGEGLPGPAASNGYFLILEIFLRPILILFGLLAGISLFSAMVKILNDVFDLLLANVSGTEDVAGMADFLRGPLDEFFYTAMYVIMCYMIGLSSFKLIDAIPNNILRWSGITVATIQEGAGDPGSEVSGKVYAGISIGTGQIKGGALAALG